MLNDLDRRRLARLGAAPAVLAGLEALVAAGGRPGRIVRVERARALVRTPDGEAGVGWSGGDPPCIGDWVAIAGQPPRLTASLERRGLLARQATGRAAVAQPLASGVDVLVVVEGLDRPVVARRLERFAVLAHEAGVEPVVALAKADLATPGDLHRGAQAARRAMAGQPVHVVAALEGEGIGPLRALAGPGRTLALLGRSGAGKTSLRNALCAEPAAATAPVRPDGRGRHTTTWRELVELPGGGALIDTPGLRGLALWVDGDGLERAFADIADLACDCRFADCGHGTEPGCAVRAAVAAGVLEADRLESHRRLSAEADRTARRRDVRARREDRRRFTMIAREARGRARP